MELFSLKNAGGAEARITNFGGIVVAVTAPDRDGRLDDVVLGFDDVESYHHNGPYLGAIIGRYGNRIGGARFTLGGKEYKLAANNGPNSLHGGLVGFDKVEWQVTARPTPARPALELAYVSRDGEEGFPGNLSVHGRYTWSDDCALTLELTATTDRETIVNLTQHSYFNLLGAASRRDVLGHEVTINASKFTPVDADLIPTGELRPVAGTPLDFRTPVAIGARIEDGYDQMLLGGGYDHNFVIDKPAGTLGLMARVAEPTTGRVLEVYSDAPGMQFYSANFLGADTVGKGGIPGQRRHAFCMEPQGYPDSPNKPQFPTVALRPGETYRHTIVYKFGVQK